MKHGRRHDSLKEGVYKQRFRQGAQGYARPYDAMPVETPAHEVAPPPAPESPLAMKLSRKSKHALRHAGLKEES